MSPDRATSPPVLGRYRLHRRLGRGASSAVFVAEDLADGRMVAVKLVPDEEGLVARARLETAALSCLGHPNIPRLLDCGRHGEALAIVQELADGPTLERAWAERRPRRREALRVVTQIFDALGHAHARGVVHRDVKPGNVVIDPDGTALLIDFGIARVRGSDRHTSAGDLIGTAAYMAPEQARGEVATPASDVWAAGMIAYEAIAGVNPLRGGGARETLARVADGRVPSLTRMRRGVPSGVRHAIHAALNPDPAGRPRARELAREFRRAGVDYRRRRATVAAGGGAAGAACIAVGAPGIAVLAGLIGIASLSAVRPGLQRR